MTCNKILESIKDIIPEREVMFHIKMDAIIDNHSGESSTQNSMLSACFHILQHSIKLPKEDWQITIWSIFLDIPKDEIIRHIK